MQTITIYKYKGDNYIISPKKPKSEYALVYRYRRADGAIAYTDTEPEGEYTLLYKRKVKKSIDEYIEHYRYKNENGVTIISTVKPDGEHTVLYKRGDTFYLSKPERGYTLMYRLVADEGKVLTKDGIITVSIDVEKASAEGWKEIEEA